MSNLYLNVMHGRNLSRAVSQNYEELNYITGIPAFNEPDVLTMLRALNDAIVPEESVLVIGVVNESEASASAVILTNQEAVEIASGFDGWTSGSI